ncbi:DUF1704 domain-containing protein [Candidatus Peregrinibacteria bacterium]|nr:MAG: DUF1704 domain-containing protein [Candidatus Peregrinibacteria bacterium]
MSIVVKMWFFHNPGLLGINARNLKYIKAYNPKKAIKLADSKLKSKSFLSARGIPVARLFGSIGSKADLDKFDWESLPASFVVKPNAGYGGEGILVIKGRKGKNWVKSTGKIMRHEELISHINDIIDGRYSLANISDIAFFEQRLEAPTPFDKMSYKGLPDIRVVVHNLIPVMAMLRLSTERSDGKANVHAGGVAVGIDIAKGELTHVTQFNKEIDSVPGYGEVKGFKMPHWEEILLIASRVQDITNLGFAAVDITLDKQMGPVFLEVNARSGLAVQIANMAPLRRRLERVEGIKVSSPEKGVRIAQDIFGQKIENKKPTKASLNKIVIGRLERVELIGEKETQKIIAQPDLLSEKSVLDRTIAENLELKDGHLKFNLADKRLRTVVELGDFANLPYQMRIGSRDLRDFLIDPTKGPANEGAPLTPHLARTFTDEDLRKLDDEIYDIDAHLRLLSNLTHTNLDEEPQKFLENPGYNPQFEYKPLSFDPNHLYARLKRLEFPATPMGILWEKKADEIRRKIELLEARDTRDFTRCSVALYGTPDDTLIQLAKKEIRNMPTHFPESTERLTASQAKKAFEEAIENYGLKGWSVKLKAEMVADAVAGKENTVFIREGAVFSRERLAGTIAHEIETHVFTAMNGSMQPWRLFQRGLADYLATEEGLAVYNQEKTESSETPKKYWPASSVIGIHIALTGSFVDVYNQLITYGFDFNRAWKVALKAKRGFGDTSKPGAFTKDFVYYKGYRMVKQFVKNGGNVKDLYIGKTNLADLSIVKQVKGLKAPVFLPSYLTDKES